jgi:hypothetical protein
MRRSTMNDIDEKIRNALEIDQEVLKNSIDEPGFFEMLMQCHRGKNRWLGFMVFFDILVFTGIGGWALYEFFHAETLESKVGWSLLFMSSLIVIGLAKLWAWMQINKNIMVREIKRVELQLVRILDMLKSQ